MNENKNFAIAIVISIAVLIAWQFFVEQPKVTQARIKSEVIKEQKINELVKLENQIFMPRLEAINTDERVKIISDKLKGSINLKGAKFDDLILDDYKVSIDENSGNIELLSPSTTKQVYLAQFGWLGADALPNKDSIWQISSENKTLSLGNDVELTFTNNNNVRFKQTISLDGNYMFKIKLMVENHGGNAIILSPYGLISKAYIVDHKPFAILHEGPLGVIDGKLAEHTYESLKKDNKVSFENKINGWVGITDKYWLTTIVPQKNLGFSSTMGYTKKNGIDRYQVDFVSEKKEIKPGENFIYESQFFAGAKVLKLLENYEIQNDIPLFDHAVDFGWLYFITKPMFLALSFLHHYLNNFGIAILALTVIIKLILFPMASKSYRSMNAMKLLHPELLRLKELHKDDKMAFNKAMMELYKREKVNPMSGCLPILIQIPIFFALYKVLFITIEMRHAPFYGWIKDLSAPDPYYIFNLFGMLPIELPALLHIGIWPVIMAFTMFVQQKMNPQPTDPVQAKVLKFMPLLFLFMFGSFPAGLIIYWAWNNILSILQQWFITRGQRLSSNKQK